MYKKLYLTIAFAIGVSLVIAQSPGGYGTGIKLWIKADAASTLGTTGGLIDSWTYANDGTKTFTATTTERPTLTANSINFKPTATFSRAQIMEGPNGVNAPLAAGNPDYSLFAVWRSTLAPASGSSFQRVWSQRHLGGADDASGFALATWDDGRYGDQMEKFVYDQAMLLNYTTSKWNISQLNVLDQATFTTNDIEARDQSNATGAAVTATSSFTRNLSDATNRLGARDNATDESLQGDIAEVIIYDDPITSATVRNQIFSYLALKYGINKAGDYIASDGTTVYWNATTNAGYLNSVFGIGLDNASGLSVIQSNSAETGSGNGAGQSGAANIVLSNPSMLSTDLSFLVIGNDNGSLAEGTTNLPAIAAGAKRLGRQWKVQHTGNMGTVDLDIDLNGLAVTGSAATDFQLMIDPDGDGDFTNNTVNYRKAASFSGGILHFTSVILPSGADFTLITQINTALPVTWKSFTAKANGNDVALHWEVESNEQAMSYEVEHSTDGLGFSLLGTVANYAGVKSYSFTHNNVSGGKHYYRLHQIDFDGKAIYSNVADVTIKQGTSGVRLLSNPVRNNAAEIEVNAPAPVNAVIELWSLTGIRIASKQQGIGAGITRLQVPLGNVVTGNYLLKVRTGDMVQLLKVTKL